ncbi:MAG: extracellular solute-binding protein [Verrucomicrobia bacterium]|nr:extracellular solute-binding protein [Verrucomicrobiota bacterium]
MKPTPKPKPFEKARQNLGVILAGLFYLASVVWVILQSPAGKAMDPSVRQITIGHWQLEDGYREGLDEIIRKYKALKAAEGVKVEITQSPIPYRAYRQWFRTQTVAGDPADIIEAPGTAEYRYFVPLSEYVGEANPYNTGTPLEGMPWRDTFLDNMHAGFIQGDYYFVATVSFVNRLFCNMDLIEAATGSRQLPKTLSEWLHVCQQVVEYGKREEEPLGAFHFRRGFCARS